MFTRLEDVISGIIDKNYFQIIFGLAFYVLFTVAMWKIFEKAGVEGWKSLIPLYSTYLLYKIVWDEKMYIAYFGVYTVYSLLDRYMSGKELDKDLVVLTIYSAVLVLCTIAVIMFEYKFCDNFSKSFGRSRGFTAGLFFLSPVFVYILAFGDAQYVRYVPESEPADSDSESDTE